MPQPSNLGWTWTGFLSPYKRVLGFMQMKSIPGCPTSLQNTQTAQKIGSRLRLGPLYGTKKKKNFFLFCLHNTVLTSQSASLLCKEDLVRIAKTRTSARVFKIWIDLLKFCFAHNMLGPACWGKWGHSFFRWLSKQRGRSCGGGSRVLSLKMKMGEVGRMVSLLVLLGLEQLRHPQPSLLHWMKPPLRLPCDACARPL